MKCSKHCSKQISGFLDLLDTRRIQPSRNCSWRSSQRKEHNIGIVESIEAIVNMQNDHRRHKTEDKSIAIDKAYEDFAEVITQMKTIGSTSPKTIRALCEKWIKRIGMLVVHSQRVPTGHTDTSSMSTFPPMPNTRDESWSNTFPTMDGSNIASGEWRKA